MTCLKPDTGVKIKNRLGLYENVRVKKYIKSKDFKNKDFQNKKIPAKHMEAAM